MNIRIVWRALLVLLLDAVALLVLSPIVPGFEVQGFLGALVVAAIAGLLNALVWPLLARYTLVLTR